MLGESGGWLRDAHRRPNRATVVRPWRSTEVEGGTGGGESRMVEWDGSAAQWWRRGKRQEVRPLYRQLEEELGWQARPAFNASAELVRRGTTGVRGAADARGSTAWKSSFAGGRCGA
jgi:hypothetical protein